MTKNKNYKADEARNKILNIMVKHKKMKTGELAIAMSLGRKQTENYIKDLSESRTPITYYRGLVTYLQE